MITVDWLFC